MGMLMVVVLRGGMDVQIITISGGVEVFTIVIVIKVRLGDLL